MINLTQLLNREIPYSTSWNRKIAQAIKLFNGNDKRETLAGDTWTKVKSDFYVKKTLVSDILTYLAKKEKVETTALKLELLAERKKNSLLLTKSETTRNQSLEILEAVNFTSWDDYYKSVLDRLNESKDRREVINEFWLVVSNYTTISTVRTRLTSFRKLIESNKELLREFRLPDVLNNHISNKSAVQNASKKVSMDKPVVKLFDIKKLIEAHSKLTELNASKVSMPMRPKIITGLISFIALASGRRLIEIAKIGSFVEVPNKPNHVLFSGQAKIKSSDREDNFAIEIPLLFTNAKTIIKAVEMLRNLLGKRILTKSNQSVTWSLSSMLSANWTKEVEGFGVSVTKRVHGLRALYAVTCERIFNQGQTNQIAQQSYFSHILGHLDYDTTTWEHYFNYQINSKGVNVKKYLKEYNTKKHENSIIEKILNSDIGKELGLTEDDLNGMNEAQIKKVAKQAKIET